MNFYFTSQQVTSGLMPLSVWVNEKRTNENGRRRRWSNAEMENTNITRSSLKWKCFFIVAEWCDSTRLEVVQAFEKFNR